MSPGPDQPDDLSFARALAAGDRRTILLFESRYRPVVRHAFSVAQRRWRPEMPVEADDYVQDFVGFLFSDGGRRLGTFEARSSFGSWLYTVALRYFQRAFARQSQDRRSDAILTSLPDLHARNAEHAAIAAHEAEQLRAAVHALPPGDQLYLRLFFVEGQNASDVARTLGKGASAVRMRKMRILERLREVLTREDDQQRVEGGR